MALFPDRLALFFFFILLFPVPREVGERKIKTKFRCRCMSLFNCKNAVEVLIPLLGGLQLSNFIFPR